MSSDGITMKEAAERLGVSHAKIWRLVKDGTLPTFSNPLDKREKRIPEEALRPLLAQQHRVSRPRPSTIGIIEDPDFQSEASEEYMQAHRRL